MKKKMNKNVVIFLCCLILFVVFILPLLVLKIYFSCFRVDNGPEAKQEFTQYFNGKDEVALIYFEYVYFEERCLNLRELRGSKVGLGSITIIDKKIFWSEPEKVNSSEYILNIYRSDLDLTNVELVFTRDGYQTYPEAYSVEDYFYIVHCSKNKLFDNQRIIDRVSLSSGEYINIGCGNDYNINNYVNNEKESEYIIEITEKPSPQEHGSFIITDSVSGIIRTIDDSYLNDTQYVESMKKFGCYPMRFDISNGHILLTYGVHAGNGWNNPHLVFEYDFFSNRLEYKLLAFPDEYFPIDIIYIE